MTPTPIAPLTPAAARRAFLFLTFTRWFPVGLTVAVLVLYQLDRGMTIPQALTTSAIGGAVVLLLELPTGGFSDVFGRRPVYLAAATVNVAAACTYLAADSFWMFAAASCLMGVFRALDSGPLDAWFVDTVHLSSPGADVDGALSMQGVVLGAAIAAGALVSGALVWWHPFTATSALTVPMVVFAALNVVHLAAVWIFMREPLTPEVRSGVRRAITSVRRSPAVVRDGMALLGSNRVLRGLVAVEVFWSIAMVVFEQFQPIRLEELLGDEAQAASWMGPVAASGWAVFALGSALAGLTSRRIGVTRAAILARLLNGLGAITMGLVAGPVALVIAYLATYSMHGAAGPMHGALLHREATPHNRATLLSINSMTGSAAFTVAAPLMGLLAVSTSNQTAMIAAGLTSLIGAVCYLPALRQEGTRQATRPGVTV
jgi:MFS family permease